jgi:hypothetical protein
MSQVTSSRVLLLGIDQSVNPLTGAAIPASGVTSGQSIAIPRENDGILSFYFRSIGTTSGGTLLIEEADWGDQEKDFAGTWSTISTVLANSFTGGAQLAVHIADCSYGYVRVRISSPITGGGSVMVSLRSRGAM